MQMIESTDCAPVAQLDRASAFEAEGREFESLRARHLIRTMSCDYAASQFDFFFPILGTIGLIEAGTVNPAPIFSATSCLYCTSSASLE